MLVFYEAWQLGTPKPRLFEEKAVVQLKSALRDNSIDQIPSLSKSYKYEKTCKRESELELANPNGGFCCGGKAYSGRSGTACCGDKVRGVEFFYRFVNVLWNNRQ